MTTVLKTTNLTKVYGTQAANDHVSMEICKGDIYGFVGQNGAGKTTFIRLVLGLVAATEGEITLFEGEDLISGRKKIGSLIEYPAVYKDLTARENLEAYGKLLQVSKERIDHVVEIVGLNRHQQKKARQLSLGLRQRLGIGIALLDEPEFLILDEPLNGLDPIGIVEMRKFLLDLNQKEHITMLISSHVLGELSKMASRYGIMKNGQLMEELTQEELQQKCPDEKAMEAYFLERMGDKACAK